jgi:uncharacterized protein with FMN-binding domain
MKKQIAIGCLAFCAAIAILLVVNRWAAGHADRVQSVMLTKHNVFTLPDGDFVGAEPFLLSWYQVEVRIEGGRIVSAVPTKDPGTEFAIKARAVLEDVVRTQGVTNVDAVTGATLASKAFLNAAQDALVRAAVAGRSDRDASARP